MPGAKIPGAKYDVVMKCDAEAQPYDAADARRARVLMGLTYEDTLGGDEIYRLAEVPTDNGVRQGLRIFLKAAWIERAIEHEPKEDRCVARELVGGPNVASTWKPCGAVATCIGPMGKPWCQIHLDMYNKPEDVRNLEFSSDEEQSGRVPGT
jgi:hypothetical protein